MKNLYSKKSVDFINSKIRLLGINCKIDCYNFLNFRLVSSFIIFFMIILFMDFGYIIAPIFVFLYFNLLPFIYFDGKIERRKWIIEEESVYFFRVLLLSIRSGNNLLNAIKSTSSSIDCDLSNEFKGFIKSYDLGVSFSDAICDMKSRIPSDIVNNILLTIKDGNDFGSNVDSILLNQIDYLRNSIISRKKSIINKIPLKISILSVVFYIPLILLLILGPVLIRFLG